MPDVHPVTIEPQRCPDSSRWDKLPTRGFPSGAEGLSGPRLMRGPEQARSLTPGVAGGMPVDEVVGQQHVRTVRPLNYMGVVPREQVPCVGSRRDQRQSVVDQTRLDQPAAGAGTLPDPASLDAECLDDNVPINKLFDHILANGPALGFNVLDRACYDDETGALCSSDPAVQNSYLFFDRLHLSTRAQQLQARYYEALIDQLDGSANLVAGLAARDGLRQGADLVAAERAGRLSAWLSGAPAEPGFRAIAEVSHGREDLDATGATLAARTDRDAYRLGFAYADDEGHTYRAVATRYEDDTRHALGQHQLEGWAVTLGGERRFGPLRLGASVSHMSGDVTGQRDLPVALMSTRYSPKFSGEAEG